MSKGMSEGMSKDADIAPAPVPLRAR